MNEPLSKVLARKGHDIESVKPTETVLAAVEKMNDRHIGAVLVCDGGRLLGIFTERDILVRVIARGADPRTTPVGEVMTKNPFSIRSDATVNEAMRLITDRRCRHLPVIDGEELRGVISIGDLTSWLVRDQQRTIEDLEDYVRRS